MPLGVSANLKHFAPYPVHLEHAVGGRAWDVDGNEYVDLTFGAGPHLLGHRHPVVTRAVEAQLGRLWQHLVPTHLEVELAERLAARYPQLERLRFTATGSEAIRGAIRVARAATGRTRVAKIEGHYHGSDDVVLVSSKTRRLAGEPDRPVGVVDSPGLSPSVLEEAVVLPWNDADAAVRIIDEHASEIACVLVEPIGFSSAGAVPTEPAFGRMRVRPVTGTGSCSCSTRWSLPIGWAPAERPRGSGSTPTSRRWARRSAVDFRSPPSGGGPT